MRLVTASALRAASFGGRRLLPASGTDGAYPSLSKLRHLCYNTAILEIGDSCLTFGAWSIVFTAYVNTTLQFAVKSPMSKVRLSTLDDGRWTVDWF